MLPVLMIMVLLVGIFSGYPVAFVLAGVGVVFALLTDVPLIFLSAGVQRIYSGILTNWLLIAVPLFIFMGMMLERSGVAERLLRSMAGILGPLPGGYGFAVAFLGIVLAASTGIIGASVVLLGLLALPVMLQNRYSPELSTGLIAASGTLGILIPPSVMLIILGDTLQISVGHLFLAAALPGLLLGGLYLAYLAGIAILKPGLTPPLPPLERLGVVRRVLVLGRDLLAPVALITAVLGSIIAGIATPTESAALGALGAFLLAVASPQLTWPQFRHVLQETTKTTAMILFVMIGATIFTLVFRRLGGEALITGLLRPDEVGAYWILFVIMATVFLLGLFLEWVEITLIVLPLIAPIIVELDFGMTSSETLLWFAILFAVNLQTSFLTPPFGYALFYIKGIAPPGISITMVYRGIVPFVMLQLVGLALIVAFPQISLWLPEVLMGR